MPTTALQPNQEIATLLAELDGLDEKHMLTLGKDSPFWKSRMEPIVRPAHELKSPERGEELAASLTTGNPATTTLIDLYSIDGTEIPKSDVPEYEELCNDLPRWFYWSSNAILRLGKYIVVSRGEHTLAGVTTLPDGETGYVFHSEGFVEESELAEFKNIWLPIVLAALPPWAEDDENTPAADWEFLFDIDGTFRVTVTSRNVFSSANFRSSTAVAFLTTTLVWNRETRELISQDPISSYVYVEESKFQQSLSPVDLETIADGLRLFADQYRAALAEDAA